MDPNANLKEQLQLARRIVEDGSAKRDGEALAELVLALDEWIWRGNFLPERWNRS